MWTVYVRTNTVNNKKYVGVTSATIEKRWATFMTEVAELQQKQTRYKKRIKKLSEGTIANDFLTFGPDAWEHQVLGTYDNPLLALLAEREWVVKLNTSTKHGQGYNRTTGGEVLLNHSTLVTLETLIEYVDELKQKL